MKNKPKQSVLPPWLSNPELLAPCPCGEPLYEDEDWLVLEGETGLMCWVHESCAAKEWRV